MAHINKITDKDPCFSVDPITRAIRNVSSTKTTLMQFDHNSERFSFTLPRYIEGHDMAEVTKAEVHYLNVDTAGVYPMNDIAVDEEHPDKITCSWLISQNATMKPGSLTFLLRFVCLSADGSVEYAWHTGTFNGISVSAGMNNLADVVEEVENDITAQWKAELFAEFEAIEYRATQSATKAEGHEQTARGYLDIIGQDVAVASSFANRAGEHAASSEASSTAAFEYKEEAARYAEEVREIAEKLPKDFSDVEAIARQAENDNVRQDGEISELRESVQTALAESGQAYVMGSEAIGIATGAKNDIAEIQGQIGDIDAELEEIKTITINLGDVADVGAILSHNHILNYGTISTSLDVTFDLPNFGDAAALYFTTPASIPENYTTFPDSVIFKGDSTQDRRFVAEENSRYTIVFENNGSRIVGLVMGVTA